MLDKENVAKILHALDSTKPDEAIAACGVFVAEVLEEDEEGEKAIDVAGMLRRMAAAIESCVP